MSFNIGRPHRHNCGYTVGETGGYDSKKFEADMQTCSHCQKSINLTEMKDDGAFCTKCMKFVCPTGPCAAKTEKFGCLPFIAYLEQFFQLQGKLAQYLKVAGLDPPETPR